MEEKERYVIDYCDDLILDTEKKYYPSGDTICKTLNQQAKRIKELEEELADAKRDYIPKLEFGLQRANKMGRDAEKENQQLKQQLHDLPKKIIGEIEKCFTEYLPLKDRTGAWFYGKLNEILKKYGGE